MSLGRGGLNLCNKRHRTNCQTYKVTDLIAQKNSFANGTSFPHVFGSAAGKKLNPVHVYF